MQLINYISNGIRFLNNHGMLSGDDEVYALYAYGPSGKAAKVGSIFANWPMGI